MATSSPNRLLNIPTKRRLSVLNLPAFLFLAALVVAIITLMTWGVSRMNAKPEATGVQRGGPDMTQQMPAQTTGYNSPPYEDHAGAAIGAQQPVQRPLTRPMPTATSQPVQQAPAASGGSGASSSGSSGASEAESQAASQRREAQQKAADAEREAAAKQEARTDSAMRSLGGVTVAVPKDEPQTVALTTASEQREYAAPSGPVLALDTQIPVELTRSLESTFQGSVALAVTADVLDEAGRTVLLPRGSTCYATSSAGAVDGQPRIYAAVNLCKLPDRRRLVLENFPVVDADGATGIRVSRVDDHGAGKRNRGDPFAGAAGMLAGTMIPGGVGGMVASGAMNAASQAGRAIPGPTLYVDASPQKPRILSIQVTKDVAIGGKP